MKNRIILLAGAGVAGVGLAMLGLSDRPEPPARGMVVVTEPAHAPEVTQPPVASAVAFTPTATGPDVEELTIAPTSGAPANYAYHEGGDPGVWATPAEFSGTK